MLRSTTELSLNGGLTNGGHYTLATETIPVILAYENNIEGARTPSAVNAEELKEKLQHLKDTEKLKELRKLGEQFRKRFNLIPPGKKQSKESTKVFPVSPAKNTNRIFKPLDNNDVYCSPLVQTTC